MTGVQTCALPIYRLRQSILADTTKNSEFVGASLNVIKQYQKEMEQYKGRTEDLTDVDSAAAFGNWLSKSMGEGAVYLAPLMLTAAVTKSPGLLAASTGMGFSEATTNRLEFLDKELRQLPPEQRAKRVAEYLGQTNDANVAAAIASGMMDVALGPTAAAARMSAKEFMQMNRKTAAKKALKELPKEVGEEFITGGAQEATQIGAGVALGEEKNFLTKENAKKIFNSAAKEAAGAPAGTALNVGRAALFTPTESPEERLIREMDEQAEKDRATADAEAKAEREAIQGEYTFIPVTDEGPEPPDIFGPTSETTTAPATSKGTAVGDV